MIRSVHDIDPATNCCRRCGVPLQRLVFVFPEHMQCDDEAIHDVTGEVPYTITPGTILDVVFSLENGVDELKFLERMRKMT